MGSSKSRTGGGVAGAETTFVSGPGGAKETRSKGDMSGVAKDASSGKGIKPVNRTRGQEEDGN